MERYTLQLRRAMLAHPGALTSAIRRLFTGGRPPCRSLVSAFTLCNDERLFARQMFERATQFWLFRSNQRLFCGDFVIIDMSARRAADRACWVLDLKLGADLCVGGGGAGVQLLNARQAIAHVAATTGALAQDAAFERLSGDRRAVLDYLGAAARPFLPVRTCHRWAARDSPTGRSARPVR